MYVGNGKMTRVTLPNCVKKQTVLRYITKFAMDAQTSAYRKMLACTVSSILVEKGFDTVEKDALGSLTEMIQAFLSEIGFLSKNYCELSGRTEPLIADVILGFTEMGFEFSSLENYIKSSKHSVLPSLQAQQAQKQLSMLSAGKKHDLPSYIPQHFPSFPDPHAYVRTPTHKQPIIDYESVREKAAVQKKDVERALTKFLAKTSPTHSLFDTDESNIFLLIASKPPYPPYLSALLPQDQIFDAEDLEYDPKAQIQRQQKEHEEAKNISVKEEQEESRENESQNDSIKSEENTSGSNFIDNPYLAATKLPVKDHIDVC
ncbi:transcription initiation factor TFIID subunit 8-like [Cylas formicarius]|uniref:transcription initiation factor TFIID subunit 8-like n=1 Tax=Cylas formicarius TaxID=197179 RepID=UPI0029588256|nr:transcription initiation factor TFIID subunit 8-like [Cylas formicarius]